MKIILATDGTKHCEPVFDSLKSLNLSVGDEIKIITVVDIVIPIAVDVYNGYLSSTPEIETGLRENAELIVKSSVEKVQNLFKSEDIVVFSEILNGSPDSQIVEAAEEFEADLIIVGSHGYNRWERLLLGSVSDSIVHHAPCSVLVVRS